MHSRLQSPYPSFSANPDGYGTAFPDAHLALPPNYGFGPYGDAPYAKSAFAQKPRVGRVNLVGIFVNFFVPCVIFAISFGTFSFSTHYYSPGLCYAVAAILLLIVIVFGYLAFSAIRRWQAGDMSRNPAWFVFLFITSLIALTVGITLGDLNFYHHLRPYYDLVNMENYPAVDPSLVSGNQLMDAGSVEFKDGAFLDMKYSMGFKNADLYCVAPISIGTDKLQTYDFWAIGLNCCSGSSTAFRCGEYNNPGAHSGLRLMRQDQRDFYRLAVNQAEASFNIKATHPIFLFWMQDTTAELSAYEFDGTRYFLMASFSFVCYQFAMVIIAVLVLSKVF